MNIEDYIIDAIRNNKKPSGKKISGHNLNYEHLYCRAHNIEPPKCLECNKKSSRFISIKKGYGKYCSKRCSVSALSKRNTEVNSHLNKVRAKKQEEQKLSKYSDILKICEDEYSSSNCSIKFLALKYNIPLSLLRKVIKPQRGRAQRVYKQNLLDSGFSKINKVLDDKGYVTEKIKSGWSSKNFSNNLGCSKNYVCSYIRKTHPEINLPKNSSSYETQLSHFLLEHNIQHLRNDREVISPKEIDIFIPSHNVAIEINGLYWHSVEKVGKNYHKEKTDMAESKNIRMLHFYDSEVIEKFPLVASLIKSSVNLSTKLYARNCIVREISNKEYKDFCIENHMQGWVQAKIKLGLIHNNELVAIMSFGTPRFNKKFEYELLRYCSKLETNVIGGASKLFQNFIKTYYPSSIISYCQRRLFTGEMYKKIGMKKTRTSAPNYVWVTKSGNRLTRYQAQKHKNNIIGKTEKEYFTSLGYHQIYDSGQFVFEWYK